jgi:hypothetical protein
MDISAPENSLADRPHWALWVTGFSGAGETEPPRGMTKLLQPEARTCLRPAIPISASDIARTADREAGPYHLDQSTCRDLDAGDTYVDAVASDGSVRATATTGVDTATINYCNDGLTATDGITALDLQHPFQNQEGSGAGKS